jgi:hypothetical protein
MPDLNALFQNLGPTGGALMSGLTTGQDLVSSMQQDQMRQAQMDEILQRTAAQRELQPLELQAKQQAVESAKLKAKQEQEAYRDDILSKAIPQLKGLKGPQRMAEMENIFAKAGLPLDEADRKHMYSQDPDKFLSDLEARHKWSIEQNLKYRTEIDKQRMHDATQERIQNSREAAALKRQQEKASQQGTLDTDLGKQKTYQGQAAVYRNHAAKARLRGEPEEAARLEALGDAAAEADRRRLSIPAQAAADQRTALIETLRRSESAANPPLGSGQYDPGAPAPRGSVANPIKLN